MVEMINLVYVTASASIAYLVSSFAFFRRPGLLHKKRAQAFTCRHISHRGGAGENLENTMSAFRHAFDCGTEMLEIDCQLTADKQVVVAHDNHLGRVAGVDAFITDITYDKLPPLKHSLELGFNRHHVTVGSNGDYKIPLLRQVFEEFPEIPINIDIKVNSDDLIFEVSKLVKLYNREHITVWGNFSDEICKKCYAHNPEIPLLFSLKRTLLLILYYYSGLLPFVHIKESFLEIMMPSIYLENPDLLLIHPNPREKFLLKLADKLLMRRSLFEHLQKRGVQIYIWVLNSEQEYRRAFELGADGVMTDFPSRLTQFLTDNPKYLKIKR